MTTYRDCGCAGLRRRGIVVSSCWECGDTPGLVPVQEPIETDPNRNCPDCDHQGNIVVAGRWVKCKTCEGSGAFPPPDERCGYQQKQTLGLSHPCERPKGTQWLPPSQCVLVLLVRR